MPPRLENVRDHAPCRGCPQHLATDSGCRVVEELATVPLDAFMAREACFLKEHLHAFAERYLAHRPRSVLDGDDLVQEVLARLLSDATLRKGGFANGLLAFLAYLRRVAVRCAITVERHERGRMRCGNCRHFAPYSGLCLFGNHAWTHKKVDASHDPRTLSPACREFQPKREPRVLDEPTEAACAGGEKLAAPTESERMEAVLGALNELAGVHPRAALVVRERLLGGKTYEDLRGVGRSVRTLKRDYSLGIEYLKKRLTSPASPAPGVTPSRTLVRSKSLERRQ